MDHSESPAPENERRLIYVTAEEQEEIRRIIGPESPSRVALLKRLEAEIECDRLRDEEKLRKKQEKLDEKRRIAERILEENAHRFKPNFKVTIQSELEEWKRFQKLSAEEQKKEIDERREDIQRYLMSKKEFLDDLQKRILLEEDDSESADDEELTESESSESETSESEDSEEEEEEVEDWREAWFKMTGERWVSVADELFGPATYTPDPKLTIQEMTEREYDLCGLKWPKKEHPERGSSAVDQKLPIPISESPQSTVPSRVRPEMKPAEKMPDQSRWNSDSDDSILSEDVPDCSDQMNAQNFSEFFASRPTTPINRETPEKLVRDFDRIGSIDVQRFPTPEIQNSSRMETRTGLVGTPPHLPQKPNSVPTDHFLSQRRQKPSPHPKKSTKSAQKRAKSQNPTASTAKRAKSTVPTGDPAEKRVLPMRAARQRNIDIFMAGDGNLKKEKIKNPKPLRSATVVTPPRPPPPLLTQFPTVVIKNELSDDFW